MPSDETLEVAGAVGAGPPLALYVAGLKDSDAVDEPIFLMPLENNVQGVAYRSLVAVDSIPFGRPGSATPARVAATC